MVHRRIKKFETSESRKVTVAELRAMEMNTALTFQLADADAIEVGKSTAYRLQRSLRCRFSAATDFDTMSLTIFKTDR